MKNVLLALSLFALVLVTGCNKTEKTSEKQGSAAETTTADTSQTEQPAPKVAAIYSCPKHPDVTSDSPGNCPECGMMLEKMAFIDPDAPQTSH